MYRSLRVPNQREEPLFPLSPRRLSWIISPAAAAELPPARVAAFAPSGITHPPSPHCGLPSPTNFLGNCLTVPSAEPRGPASPLRPHLPSRRTSGVGNGWGLCTIHLRATPLC